MEELLAHYAVIQKRKNEPQKDSVSQVVDYEFPEHMCVHDCATQHSDENLCSSAVVVMEWVTNCILQLQGLFEHTVIIMKLHEIQKGIIAACFLLLSCLPTESLQ